MAAIEEEPASGIFGDSLADAALPVSSRKNEMQGVCDEEEEDEWRDEEH